MILFDELKLKINAMEPQIDELGLALGVETLKKELSALDEQTGSADFWQNAENTQEIMQKIKRLRDKIDLYGSLKSRVSDVRELCDLAIADGEESLFSEISAEVTALEKALDSARLQTLLSGPYDKQNAILSFQAGAGGTEAQDWAEMLYRLYTRWAERHSFSYKILDYLEGDGAGIKSASILIEGENAYGYLKSENGVHRLVRISPFDSSGRRHTSFAAIEVMPEISEDIQVDIREEDLKVDTYRSGGAGGQHVNKTESAVRITHIPSGVVVACQNERSQHQNREVCMRMLKSKLIEIKEREHYEKVEDIKGVQKFIEWGSQIRSYVFMPYTLCKDHRTNFENGNIGAVMDGDIDGFINAYLKMEAGTLLTHQ